MNLFIDLYLIFLFNLYLRTLLERVLNPSLEDEVTTSLIARMCSLARQHPDVTSHLVDPRVRGYALQLLAHFEGANKGAGRLKRAVQRIKGEIKHSARDGDTSAVRSEMIFLESAVIRVRTALNKAYRQASRESRLARQPSG